MYVTLQFVSIIINRIVVTKHVNPDLEKNAVHSYEYSNISAKNGQPSSVIKPRQCETVGNVYVLMYSKIPLIPWVWDQTGATLPNIPDYQTPPILIISTCQTLVRPALMYGTERHILSNYMVQCRKKNGE